ncbi:restriction endonuclease subunit S [Xanthomonas translucens]|uniref:restriction endonuclease subunit S n=1 Tax=Xanthomonas campestris pv. translucens TaxID=343 RepID=UPI0009BFE40F|nr:restriction endonuclease subunit S [Xanthomonas translucens]QEN92445.1 restriction endonuclease subunit S [Xanthomonas translucens pv. undulosa]
MLPKDWRRLPFGDVASIGSGQVNPKNEPYASMLHIGPENIESGSGRILSPKKCSELGLISGKYEFDENAVVYSKIRPNLNKVCHPGFRGVCSADAYPIWPNSKKLIPEYLKNYMLGSDFIKRAVACSMRTGMPKVNREDLDLIPISIPPLDEQRRISHILSTWDQAIATTERLLANGRMQWNALIGLTLHLPSANRDASAPAENSGFPASVQPGIPTLPPAPPGWRRIQLRDHLKEVRRPVALVNDETYTLVTVKRSRGGVELREVLQGNEVKTPTQFYVHADDFLISKRQIVHGACGIVPPALDGAVVSNEYAVLNTDGEIDLRFLRYLSESRYFQQTCFHSSIGVHVEKMIFKTDHWLNWRFNIPPLAQQEHIVEILDTASREIVSISEQLKALKREKSALMAQLLTGKRRVHLPADETVSA